MGCMPSESIISGFKTCGTSNSLDGFEDDLLWEELVEPEQKIDDSEE